MLSDKALRECAALPDDDLNPGGLFAKEAASEILRLREREKQLEGALGNLCDKLDVVAKDTEGMFTLAHARGHPYAGANWGEEYKQARALLPEFAEVK